MGHGERAELDTEDYITESTVLENFIILRPNPNYVAEETEKKKKWFICFLNSILIISSLNHFDITTCILLNKCPNFVFGELSVWVVFAKYTDAHIVFRKVSILCACSQRSNSVFDKLVNTNVFECLKVFF